MILETALICMALNIYHEARSELVPGQYGVAHVTLNRARQQDKPICEIVTAPKQFSWTNTLVTKQGGKFVLERRGYPKDEYAWQKAIIIARTAMARPDLDLTGGATFYHATYVAPAWRKSLKKTKQLGAHIFYKAT